MKYQFLPNSSPKDANIIILPILYEDTVSAKIGTKDAAKAILKATNQIEYYEEDLQWSPMKHVKIRVEDEITSFSEISKVVSSLPLDDNKLLISLGGEHSITPMITSELLTSNSTIIFLDAHADLRESYQGSPYSHATPSHHLLAQGHKMIMVGIRSLFEKEALRVKEDENIAFFSDRKLRKQSVRIELLTLIASLEGDVYLSVDMDVFNPAYVPSVGTPQPGGIDYYFATDIFEALFLKSSAIVKGVDIVELIPEPSNVSQVFAAKLLQKIISYWAKSNDFDKKELSGSQTLMEYE